MMNFVSAAAEVKLYNLQGLKSAECSDVPASIYRLGGMDVFVENFLEKLKQATLQGLSSAESTDVTALIQELGGMNAFLAKLKQANGFDPREYRCLFWYDTRPITEASDPSMFEGQTKVMLTVNLDDKILQPLSGNARDSLSSQWVINGDNFYSVREIKGLGCIDFLAAGMRPGQPYSIEDIAQGYNLCNALYIQIPEGMFQPMHYRPSSLPVLNRDLVNEMHEIQQKWLREHSEHYHYGKFIETMPDGTFRLKGSRDHFRYKSGRYNET